MESQETQDTQRNSLVLLPLSPDTVRNILPQGAQLTIKDNHLMDNQYSGYTPPPVNTILSEILLEIMPVRMRGFNAIVNFVSYRL